MDKGKSKKLKLKASSLRKLVIEMLTEAGSGHPGGSLSSADIVSVLYFDELNIDPNNPEWENRDRFVLSKGHACPIVYAALAEKGFFEKDILKTLRKTGSILQGHPDMKKVPGIDFSTGSLGQGLSGAVGMALAGKLDEKDYRVYAIVGDGEIQEGMIWEAAMAAAHYKLDNLTVFVDNNSLQIDGSVEDIMCPQPIVDKLKAFGWDVSEIDGHNIDEILLAIKKAKNYKGKPTAIVAKTVKGKGVSFMAGEVGWHGKAPSLDESRQAISELEKEEV